MPRDFWLLMSLLAAGWAVVGLVAWAAWASAATVPWADAWLSLVAVQ